MYYSAEQIAGIIGGKIVGDPKTQVTSPSGIENANKEHITFLGNLKYEHYLYTTQAGIVLIPEGLELRQEVKSTLILVTDVYQSLAILLGALESQSNWEPGISSRAFVAEDVQVDNTCRIEHFAVLESGVQIGEKVYIHSQTYIGKDVVIGAGTIIHTGARILKGCVIGKNCVIHQNAVIGSEGFGFAKDADGKFKRIPHSGNVVIGDDVEVGVNSVIDKGSVGATILGDGVKLDNLVHIAHNVSIGEHSALAAQVGVAGSTKIGKHCLIGGQVGISGHLTIADGTEVQAQSGIASSVQNTGAKLFGSPAFDYKKFVKSHIIFRDLPKLDKKIRNLEKRLFERDSNKPE